MKCNLIVCITNDKWVMLDTFDCSDRLDSWCYWQFVSEGPLRIKLMGFYHAWLRTTSDISVYHVLCTSAETVLSGCSWWLQASTAWVIGALVTLRFLYSHLFPAALEVPYSLAVGSAHRRRRPGPVLQHLHFLLLSLLELFDSSAQLYAYSR